MAHIGSGYYFALIGGWINIKIHSFSVKTALKLYKISAETDFPLPFPDLYGF